MKSFLFLFGVVAVCTAALYYNPASPIEDVEICPGEGNTEFLFEFSFFLKSLEVTVQYNKKNLKFT